jgi:hypothetical protein
MVKDTKRIRSWVNEMFGPIPTRPYAAGTPRLRLDDMGRCKICGAVRLMNELKTFGGNCAECAGF